MRQTQNEDGTALSIIYQQISTLWRRWKQTSVAVFWLISVFQDKLTTACQTWTSLSFYSVIHVLNTWSLKVCKTQSQNESHKSEHHRNAFYYPRNQSWFTASSPPPSLHFYQFRVEENPLVWQIIFTDTPISGQMIILQLSSLYPQN